MNEALLEFKKNLFSQKSFICLLGLLLHYFLIPISFDPIVYCAVVLCFLLSSHRVLIFAFANLFSLVLGTGFSSILFIMDASAITRPSRAVYYILLLSCLCFGFAYQWLSARKRMPYHCISLLGFFALLFLVGQKYKSTNQLPAQICIIVVFFIFHWLLTAQRSGDNKRRFSIIEYLANTYNFLLPSFYLCPARLFSERKTLDTEQYLAQGLRALRLIVTSGVLWTTSNYLRTHYGSNSILNTIVSGDSMYLGRFHPVANFDPHMPYRTIVFWCRGAFYLFNFYLYWVSAQALILLSGLEYPESLVCSFKEKSCLAFFGQAMRPYSSYIMEVFFRPCCEWVLKTRFREFVWPISFIIGIFGSLVVTHFLSDLSSFFLLPAQEAIDRYIQFVIYAALLCVLLYVAKILASKRPGPVLKTWRKLPIVMRNICYIAPHSIISYWSLDHMHIATKQKLEFFLSLFGINW